MNTRLFTYAKEIRSAVLMIHGEKAHSCYMSRDAYADMVRDSRYEYQANVNTLIGSLRERLADAVFSSDPNQRLKKLDRVMLEIQRSVVPIRPDDGSTPRYQYPRKSKYHHNKKSNL